MRSPSHVVARNSFYNLLTQGLLALLAFWALPQVVRGLSKDGFGLLTIVWSFVGYFTLLDFGVSRAATKFLADAFALDAAGEVYKITWTSVNSLLLIGIVCSAIVIGATPWLVHDVFHLSSEVVAEAQSAFILSAISIPFMLVFGILKGVQMALQRFDIVNVFQAVMGVSQWGG